MDQKGSHLCQTLLRLQPCTGLQAKMCQMAILQGICQQQPLKASYGVQAEVQAAVYLCEPQGLASCMLTKLQR